ncbi:hypothetical protein DJ021_07055 [Phenylobacterium hankyongense]|uniref:Uncharacterized protein n=1 Tax=Phenylobacterium hankyongense TaxID=1813876 RepID=A0A328B0X8_9CAUL|nr:hypothetical protein [Phenylobacterium hankyongense]RAK59576.1 hypothetical protein DJ021_07055 [Phenylobacterium hankyongense]
MKLEDIQKGKVVAGVVPGKLVKVVAAEMRGSDELELVYRADGVVSQRRLSRADEDGLVLASAARWSPKLSPGIIAALAMLVGAVAVHHFWPASGLHLWSKSRSGTNGPASNDIPIVIRTDGGMLEVANVKHRRTFNLTNVLTVAGISVPFCKATASYTVDTRITYRVRLARYWGAFYHDQRLEIWAPRLEPALPVAFDTSKMMTTLNECPFIPRGTQDDVLRLVSAQLEKDAWSPQYVQLAQNGGARDTVREFVRKWLINQKGSDIPRGTPIGVNFQP